MDENAPTPFDTSIDAGGECLLAIARLERKGRLTAPAFRAMALANASIDEKRLEEIHAQLEQSTADELKVFVRRISKVLMQPSVPCPPGEEKAGKFFRGYSSQAGEALLGQLNLRVLDLIALASYRASEDERLFGKIDNWATHTKRLSELHDQLSELVAAASRNWSSDDIIVDNKGLSSAERAAGHSIVRFRRAEDLNPSVAGFALQMMQRAATALIEQAERPDEDDEATSGARYAKRERRRLKGSIASGKPH